MIYFLVAILVNIIGWGIALILLKKGLKKNDQTQVPTEEPQIYEGPLMVASYCDNELDEMVVFDSSTEPMGVIYINPKEEVEPALYKEAFVLVDDDGVSYMVL